MPTIPSTLPPSVEEAYRRKCVQLKNRTNEVENANDAARLRLARIKRQVEKLRIERAFLLEQLSKRTSTNVEDSDGSPSPPPTPKDKPLRTKRGHRKAMAGDAESKTNAGGANGAQSPTRANGISKTPKRPVDGFGLFCDEHREAIEAKKKDADSDLNIHEELVRLWYDLHESDKEVWQTKFEKAEAKYKKEQKKKEEDEALAAKKGDKDGQEDNDNEDADIVEDKEDKEAKEDKEDKNDKEGKSDDPDKTQEDVEMTNYDTEDQEDAPADKS